jgi:hypothetical protein
MSEMSLVGSEHGTQEEALSAISKVAALCRSAESDPAVEREIRELEAIRSAVEDRWPLLPSVKQRIDLGPFAAKNIADWNPELADSLMLLDYALQHDLVSQERADLEQIPVKESRSYPVERAQHIRTA